MYVCALTNASRVLLQSDREKEVSSRDACSVANLATFSTFVDFFYKCAICRIAHSTNENVLFSFVE